MFVSKCAAGSAFQVTLKFARSHLLLKRGVEDQFPRHEFPGVGAVAAIVLVEAMSQFMRQARINLCGIRNAAEQIYVVHDGPPSRGTERLYDVT